MPPRKLNTETYYHVYNRGHNKQLIFLDSDDYKRFYANIERYLQTHPRIEIFAYCFLPNHFHFLLREREETSPGSEEPGLATQISSFMNRVQQAYAMYFNARHGESVKPGLKLPVFEGRFKAKSVDSEEYLAQLQVYIEHNAVKHELVDRSEDWPWTSYQPLVLSPGLNPGLEFNPVFA